MIEEEKKIPKPRIRRDTSSLIKAVTRDFHKFYKKKYKNTEEFVKDPKDVRNILKVYHENVQEIVSESRGGFDLMGIGTMAIVSYPIVAKKVGPKNLVNPVLSKKFKKVINYTNLDTDGTICRIFFSFRTKESKLIFKDAWAFRGCRGFKKKVSDSFKKNFNTFISIKSFRNKFK